MVQSLFSASWYRVAGLKPRLRTHAQVHRHHYRGQLWHVLQDHASGQFHRFSPAAFHVIALMDGSRTVHEIWERTIAQLGDDAPTQEETIRLLAQLHAADVLQCDVPPDGVEVFQRYQKRRRQVWRTRFSSPLALRFPLFDPDRLLQWALPLVRPLFGWVGALLWIAVVGTALVLAGIHWQELTQDVADRALAPANLLAIGLTFPFVKALHELGHGFATRHWGGEVHEIGVMLLVFMPVPYVDASAASAFRERRKRAIVGAAGIVVELFVAALALFVWLEVQPGAVRATAYNVMLISGVSTLLFNGNPLLRFDGYYVFSDLIEIPNLAQRSTAYVGYLFQRHLFGVEDARSPATAPGEPGWFVAYAVASFVYRVFLSIRIMLFVLGKHFGLGLLIGGWTAFQLVLRPLGSRIRYLMGSQELHEKRLRAAAASAALVLLVLGVVFALPLPLRTRTEGVVWLPEDTIVRAGVDGFAVRLLAEDGAAVRAGEPLVECADELVAARARDLELRVRELELEEASLRPTDRVRAQLAREERAAVLAELARARERLAALVIRSPLDGTFVVPAAADLPGRVLPQGVAVGYVVDLASVTARVVVEQADIALVRQSTRGVEVRLAENLAEPVAAEVLREVPGASETLPSNALGLAGGGSLAIDPRDASGARALERVFQLDVRLPAQAGVVNVGGRVHVLFDHGTETLAQQAYRSARQLFLRRFGV
jgi:putative peptide zinc metalloprotease protein